MLQYGGVTTGEKQENVQIGMRRRRIGKERVERTFSTEGASETSCGSSPVTCVRHMGRLLTPEPDVGSHAPDYIQSGSGHSRIGALRS